MASKPTEKPLWATEGDKIEPELSRKKTGWEYLDKPPYEWFNWLLNLIYRWIDWLEEKIVNLQTNNQNIVEAADLTYDETDTDQVLNALQSRKVIPFDMSKRLIRLKARRSELAYNDSGVYISNCQCRDAGNTCNIIYNPASGGFSKYALQNDGSGLNEWTEGSDNGGFADNNQPPSEQDFFAYIHVLYNSNNGNIDFGFDTTVEGTAIRGDANVKAAGYDVSRCIGFIRVVYDSDYDPGSNNYWIMPFNQIDNKIYFGESPLVFNTQIGSKSWTDITLVKTAPSSPNFKALIGCDLLLTGEIGEGIRYSPFKMEDNNDLDVGLLALSDVTVGNGEIVNGIECYFEDGHIQLKEMETTSPYVGICPKWCDLSLLTW